MKNPLSEHNVKTCGLHFSLSVIIIVAGLIFPIGSSAHGPLHEQIQRLTKEIAQFPDSAGLYLQRGELHRHHQDWKAALADYGSADSLAPHLAMVDLCRGKMFLEARLPEQAKGAVERFLSKAPNDAEGLLTRGRALVQLGLHSPAADDFTRAIQNLEMPQPEHYFERSQALVAAGRMIEALHGIDEGIKRLGEIVTLQVYAIDLEIKLQCYDAALARLEKVASQSPRKEKWLSRRGEILQMAGRDEEARQAFQAALREIESLSPQHRNTKTIIDLEKRVRSAIGT